MKIVIENYRGWEIYFDTQKETFYAVSSEFDVDKTKQSFAAIKKSIDDYIKENVNFKPFKAIVGGWGGYTIKEFVGIRKDLRFITKKGDSTEQFSESDENNLYEYSELSVQIVSKIKETKNEINNFIETKNKEIKSLENQLVKFEVKDIKEQFKTK